MSTQITVGIRWDTCRICGTHDANLDSLAYFCFNLRCFMQQGNSVT